MVDGKKTDGCLARASSINHSPSSTSHLHLVGIAGVGMSALAQALINAGHVVTGSDRFLDQGRENLGVLETLRRAGAKLFPQDGSGVTAQTSAVVVSTAIEADNPDLAAAKKFGVPVRHRSELLAELVAGKKLLAIAGTAGKTTTTALVGHLLVELGADPSVVNGGVVLGWQQPDALGSARKGRDDLWVLETDESDRSLLRFAPDWAIITNISKDHFELDEVVALFRKFSAQVKTGIICGPGVAELIRGYTSAALIEPKLTSSLMGDASVVDATSGRIILDKRPEAASTTTASLNSESGAASVEATSGRFSSEKRLESAATLPHFFDPHASVAKLSGNLPHWRQPGATYFVTFRTADSLPQEKLEQWSRERLAWLQHHPEPHAEAEQLEYHTLFTKRFELWMDAGYGACLLAQPEVRGIVEATLRHFDGERYRLDEFVVMPNHVHALVTPLGEHRLSEIVRSWKTFSAREIGKITGQTGGLWQKEYFDHRVRNAEQLGRIRDYIQNNPKALHGLVSSASGPLCCGTVDKRPEAASSKAATFNAASGAASVEATSGRFFPVERLESAATYPSTLPGRHNAENVALAAALCEQLGFAPEKIRAALTSFRGIHRRLEKAGEREGITVFDDYAHNPAKIAAACAAVQPERGRLFAVWRPHGFGPLKLMLGELTDALAGVLRPHDSVLLLPVFYAGGTTSSALNSDALVDALVARGVAAQLAPDYATLEARLRAELKPGDVVLIMGARDPDLPLFAHRLVERGDAAQ